MGRSKGLVIVHVDGLAYGYLLQALEQGRMPFVQRLLEEEGYQVLRYRCGLPSTTPYVQAGLLYGDNSEIPSYRWWDKQSGVLVSFGGFSTFGHVAHKYFRRQEPLTEGGAAIATCYPDAAATNYRLGYKDRRNSVVLEPFSHKRVLTDWAMNPLLLLDWTRRGLFQIWKSSLMYWRTRLRGHPASRNYVISDMLQEILIHQITRYAVVHAMANRYPVIYGAFYAYDGTAHAFGPESDFAFRILRHIDNTIRRIAQRRTHADADGRDYELLILSDHGQVPTAPFDQVHELRLADLVGEWLPSFEIEEIKGKKITRRGAIDGHIALMYSGGLAHVYFKDISWRLHYDEVEERFPGLISRLAHTPGIGFVLMRNGAEDWVVSKGAQLRISPSEGLSREARDLLGRFDEPEIAARQLHRLNSFERSGDLILFGDYANHHQINFEDQVGGHGALGGAQQFAFLMAKREWNIKTTDVIDSTGLYPQLIRLRDRLLGT